MAIREGERINYNYLALRGVDVDDIELQEEYPNIPTEVLYTPGINDKMLDITYALNIEAGLSEADALKKKVEAERNLKELYAKNGLLDKVKDYYNKLNA
jgi:hypothetical protein